MENLIVFLNAMKNPSHNGHTDSIVSTIKTRKLSPSEIKSENPNKCDTITNLNLSWDSISSLISKCYKQFKAEADVNIKLQCVKILCDLLMVFAHSEPLRALFELESDLPEKDIISKFLTNIVLVELKTDEYECF